MLRLLVRTFAGGHFVPHQVQEQVGQRGRGQDGAVQKEDGARKRVEGLGSMLLSRFFSQKKKCFDHIFSKTGST
jgi:hypothetical protein